MKGQPILLRIILEAPPAGVLFSLQDADNTPVDAQEAGGGDLSFEVEVRCDLAGGRPNFLGRFARGTPTERFVYIAAGRQAGQAGTCWDRRAKLRLGDISADQVRAAALGGILTARIPARMRDGSPVCAAVKPLSGWELSSDPASGTPSPSAREARPSRSRTTTATTPNAG